MINPRAIATLGIGYGPIQAAALGMLDDAEPSQHPQELSAGGYPMRVPRRGEYIQKRRRRQDESLLLCGLI